MKTKKYIQIIVTILLVLLTLNVPVNAFSFETPINIEIGKSESKLPTENEEEVPELTVPELTEPIPSYPNEFNSNNKEENGHSNNLEEKKESKYTKLPATGISTKVYFCSVILIVIGTLLRLEGER